MKLHIHHGDIHLLALRTRMPFKYGIATMTRAPHAFVRLEVNVEGRAAEGVAADHLPPKWFTKDPTRAIDDEVAEMLRVIDHAVRTAHGLQAESVFDAWRELFDLGRRFSPTAAPCQRTQEKHTQTYSFQIHRFSFPAEHASSSGF